MIIVTILIILLLNFLVSCVILMILLYKAENKPIVKQNRPTGKGRVIHLTENHEEKIYNASKSNH